jgi:hypothetical protein
MLMDLPIQRDRKINLYLLEYSDALKLYRFFFTKKDPEACRRITIYLRLLSDDLDRLIELPSLLRLNIRPSSPPVGERAGSL